MAQPRLFFDLFVTNQQVMDNFLELLQEANEIDVFRRIFDEEEGDPDELDAIIEIDEIPDLEQIPVPEPVWVPDEGFEDFEEDFEAFEDHCHSPDLGYESE